MSFGMNGVNQEKVDLNLRSNAPRLDNVVRSLSGLTQYRYPAGFTGTTLVLVMTGQSTSDAWINSTYTVTNTGKIFDLSIAHGGAIFNAIDPLVNSTNPNAPPIGQTSIEFADALVTAGKFNNVILVPAGVGQSYGGEWNPGGGTSGTAGFLPGVLSYRIGLIARCLNAAGLWNVRTDIVWQNGEANSSSGTATADLTPSLNGMIAEWKRVGVLRTGNRLWINKCTDPVNGVAGAAAVRASQAAVVDGVLVKAGFDSDTIISTHRIPLPGDGIHYNALGRTDWSNGMMALY